MTEHLLSIESSFLSDGVGAVCSCGWERDCGGEDEAVEAWEDHRDVVFMEATYASAEPQWREDDAADSYDDET